MAPRAGSSTTGTVERSRVEPTRSAGEALAVGTAALQLLRRALRCAQRKGLHVLVAEQWPRFVLHAAHVSAARRGRKPVDRRDQGAVVRPEGREGSDATD